MTPLIRSLVAVLAGIVVAMAVVFGIEAVAGLVFSHPSGNEITSREQLRQIMTQMSLRDYLMVLLAWFTGTFAGGWTAARVAKRSPAKYVGAIAGVMLAGTVLNLVQIPHPGWFWLAGPTAVLLGAVAARAASRERAVPGES